MSDEELARRQSKTRRAWDHHGSWLLLVVIATSCFMAGSQFNASSTGRTIQVIMESHERQDQQRIARIRELNDANINLTLKLGPQVSKAAEKASEAAVKASEAVEKATAGGQ